MLGNCPFSPQLRGRKMEYELLELSFVSFSYCCVIFNVIDAGVSGHIFSLEIAFNIPPFKLFDWFFSAINEYFQEYCPPNTPSSELYSEHLFSAPLALYEPCLRCAGQNGEVLSGLCRMKMCWSLRAETRAVSINLRWKDGLLFLAQTGGVGQRAGFWYYRSANGEQNERGVLGLAVRGSRL